MWELLILYSYRDEGNHLLFCQCFGKVLPSSWQGVAEVLARCCQPDGSNEALFVLFHHTDSTVFVVV